MRLEAMQVPSTRSACARARVQCIDSIRGRALQVNPGAPEAFAHTLAVAVAHLEPARLAVSGAGALPSVVLTLARLPSAAYERCLAAALGDAELGPAHVRSSVLSVSRWCTTRSHCPAGALLGPWCRTRQLRALEAVHVASRCSWVLPLAVA